MIECTLIKLSHYFTHTHTLMKMMLFNKLIFSGVNAKIYQRYFPSSRPLSNH